MLFFLCRVTGVVKITVAKSHTRTWGSFEERWVLKKKKEGKRQQELGLQSKADTQLPPEGLHQ